MPIVLWFLGLLGENKAVIRPSQFQAKRPLDCSISKAAAEKATHFDHQITPTEIELIG